MAPDRSRWGTRLGMSEEAAGFMKARATPNTARMEKIHAGEIAPVTVSASMARPQAASTNWQTATMTRRL